MFTKNNARKQVLHSHIKGEIDLTWNLLSRFLIEINMLCRVDLGSKFVLSGMAAPVAPQPQFIVPAPSPQYMQGSGSDQTAGWGLIKVSATLWDWWCTWAFPFFATCMILLLETLVLLQVSFDCSRTKSSGTATWVAGFGSSLANYIFCILEVQISSYFLLVFSSSWINGEIEFMTWWWWWWRIWFPFLFRFSFWFFGSYFDLEEVLFSPITVQTTIVHITSYFLI